MLLEVNRDGSVRGEWRSPAAYPIGLAWLGELNPDSEYEYLVASDRDGLQRFYFYDPSGLNPGSGGVPSFFLEREVRVESGPRGMTADVNGLWHIVTDFTGGVLQSANVMRFGIENLSTQQPLCDVSLTSALASTINARGVELDQRDKSLWITDFGGNIFKVASCFTPPGPSDSGYISTVSAPGNRAVGLEMIGAEPNPFSRSTALRFQLASADRVEIRLYDGHGRLVTTIAEQAFEAGEHRVQIEPKGLPAGAYHVEITTRSGARTATILYYLR